MSGPTQFSSAQLARLTSLRQGDLLRVERLPLVTIPWTSSRAEELGEQNTRNPTTVEVALPTSLAAVVSGDCDLERAIEIEPSFVVAPVFDLDDEQLYRRARDGVGSSRIFAIPAFQDPLFEKELTFPVIDIRWVYPVEKTMLASPDLDDFPCRLDQPARDRLRLWLGRRFGRLGFPEDVQTHVVEPLIRVLSKPPTAQREVIRLRDSALFYGVRWTEGSSVAALLVVLDPARRAQANLDEGAARGAQTAIRRGLHGRTGSYTVPDITVADAREISFLDVQAYRQFFLDPSSVR